MEDQRGRGPVRDGRHERCDARRRCSGLVTDAHAKPGRGVAVTPLDRLRSGLGHRRPTRRPNASGIATVGSGPLGTNAGANTISGQIDRHLLDHVPVMRPAPRRLQPRSRYDGGDTPDRDRFDTDRLQRSVRLDRRPRREPRRRKLGDIRDRLPAVLDSLTGANAPSAANGIATRRFLEGATAAAPRC